MFYEPYQKDHLGENGAYVVGFGDSPLEPGFKKEVFFGSTVGYKISEGSASALLYGYYQFGDMAVDLYAQTDGESEPLKVATYLIAKKFQR